MRNKMPTRQSAQDLILLANAFADGSSDPLSIREILFALTESNLTLVMTDENDHTALFALALLDNPSLQGYDPSIEVLV